MYELNDYDQFATKMEHKYPKMFGGLYGGFACGPGWWPILESLCNAIHNHVEWTQNQLEKYGQGPGCPDVVVTQIKEKLGGLRFYYKGGDDTVYGMIRMAEEWAAHTCEECGQPGILRSGGWIRTLCDHHEELRQQRNAERQA